MQDGQFQIEDPKPKKKAKLVKSESDFGTPITIGRKQATPVSDISDFGADIIVKKKNGESSTGSEPISPSTSDVGPSSIIDKDAVLNWINQKFPKQPVDKQEILKNSIANTPVITAVDKKKPLTKKEVEQEAVNNLVSGRSDFNPSSEDPVGDMIKKINTVRDTQSIDDFFEGNWKEPANNNSVKDKEIDVVKDMMYNNGDEAGVALQEFASKKGKPDISKLDDNEIKNLAEGNETMKLAAEKYTGLRNLENTLGTSRNFEDAAVNYMQNRYDKELSGEIKFLRKEGKGTNILLNEPLKGQIMFDFLSDKNLKYLKDKDPKVNEQYTKAMYNFPNQYPDLAEKLVSEMIANEREKKGLNNFIVNIVGKESTDKIVDDLIERGDLLPSYKAIYEERIRPSLGVGNAIGRGIGNTIPGLQQFVNDSKIPTPGLAENMQAGFENTLTGTGKTLATLSGARRLYSDESDRINSALEKQLTTRSFEPESLGHKASMVGGHLAGFVLGLSPGSTAIKGLGLLKNAEAATSAAMGMAVYGDYADRAKQMMPGEPIKQYLYTGVMTSLNMVGAKFLPGTQINKVLQKEEAEILNTVGKAAESKISTDYAISQIKDQVMPKIIDIIKKTHKGNLGAAEFMAANSFVDQSLSQVLKGEHLDVANNSIEAMKQFGLGYLGATFLSAAGTAIENNKGVRNQIYDIASHPEDYREALDIASQLDPSFEKMKPDIIDNLNIISSVKKQLDSETNLSDKQKESYVLKSLQEHALEKKISELTEPELKKPLQEKLKAIQEAKKKVLEPVKEINDQFKERIAAAETESEKEAIMKEHADLLSKQAEEPDLLSRVKEKAGFKDGDLQYYIDKAGEDPTEARKVYGEDVANELLVQVPTEKLQQNFDKAVELGATDTADAIGKELDARENTEEINRIKSEINSKYDAEIAELEKQKSVPEGGGEVKGEVKVGDKFLFADKPWEVTEVGTEKVKATNGQVQSSFPKEDVALNVIKPTRAGPSVIMPEENKPLTQPITKEGVSVVQPEGKPPEPPIENTETTGEPQPEKEWTAIRKEKQTEIDEVKKAYEDQKVKHWEQSLDNGLKKLQADYPDKSVYEASLLERDRLAQAIRKNEKPNINDETLAVLQNLKRETSEKIAALSKQLNSPDDATRTAALGVGEGLLNDMVKTALVIKAGTTEAGRTLNYAQSELSFDPEHGLQIRRMQLQQANGGKPLSDAQLESTAKRWEKEKELIQKEQEIREKAMQDAFDKKIEEINKDYEKKLSDAKKAGKSSKPEKGKFESKAKVFAEKIMKSELPSWLKADLPEGTQSQGFDVNGMKKLLAEATINMGKLLDKGVEFADAVKEAVQDIVKALGEGRREDIEKGFAAHYKSLDEQSKDLNAAALDAIKEEVVADKNMGGNITDITKGMVAKNQIRDFVESYFGTVKPKDILDKATEDLQKILPDVTKPKLVEAYLKAGDYELPTEEKLKSEIADNRKVLTKLAGIEKDLNDLKTKADVLRKEGRGRQAEKADDAVLEKQNELEKELNKIGQKISSHDKYSQASFETRASLHNDRMQSISDEIQNKIDKSDLTPEEKAGLQSLQQQLQDSKIMLNDKSKLNPGPIIEHGLNRLKEIKKSFKGNEEVKTMLQKAIDQFEKDRKETEQDAKLQRTIKRLENENKRKQGQLDRGETGFKQPDILTKSNAELIKLKIQRNIIDGEFMAERRKLEERNKSYIRRVFDRAKSMFVTLLIYKPTTLAKVGWTGLIRPASEAGSRLFGRTMKPLSPAIMERAKAGGESTSTQVLKDMFMGQFRSISEDALKQKVDKSQQEYEAAAKKYTDAKEAGVEGKELQKLKNDMDNALLDYHSNSPYQFIGSSSFKDVFDAFMRRSNKIEREFGFLEKEQFKDKGLADKMQYLWEAVGRSHSALKTISARANFVAGFMARAEYAIEHDVSLTPEKLLEIANDSYLDWERGKYQQSVFVTDEMNVATRAILRDVKGTKWEKYGDYLTGLLKMDVVITRVPVNLLHEAVTEYTLGAFRALYKIGKTQIKAKKEAKSSGATINSPEFKAAVKDYISKMEATEAAKIVRLYRKGGVGLGLFAVLALGGILHYGGFHHKNEKKKFRHDELQPGEVEVGDTRLNKFLSAIVSHTQFLTPAFLGANTAHAYNEKIRKKETTFNAAKDAIMSDLQYMQDQIPQSKLLPVLDVTQNTLSSTMRQLGIPKPKK